ncbi:MAG TPA: hypothetical protein VGB38_07565 [bacterium]
MGGYAVGFHSRPKFTQDLDVWIECNADNASRMLAVFKDFGFSDMTVTMDDLKKQDTIIQLGVAPLRIDIMTGVSGLRFSSSYKKKIKGTYSGVSTHFVSVQDLLKNKRASGRENDLQDVQWIRKYAKK